MTGEPKVPDWKRLLAKLVDMGVLKPPDEPKAIEGTVED